MLRRLTLADWAAGLAGTLGLLAVFLPWYSYAAGPDRITVNGFRASVFGDVFFIAIAALGLLLLVRHGVIDDPRGLRRRERSALLAVGAVIVGALLIQLILIAGGDRSVRPGFGIAVVAAIALSVSLRVQFGVPARSISAHAVTDREPTD